ncbi:helix-turn-helix domain-containing protein [Rhodoblastus sp.]|uniref:helix-turn-helix transcriptional regulator n=1 Tax=Rhodoblastus sp. TaxID=1962975 RepID=UPI00260C73FC|nr:helix-turn-helix domain-containing protein [Rhodoblastus sp.]
MTEKSVQRTAATRIDEHEAAAYLGGEQPLSVRTLQKWRSLGYGPRYFKLGAVVRYAVADLDAFLAAGARDPRSEAAHPGRNKTATESPGKSPGIAGRWRIR